MRVAIFDFGSTSFHVLVVDADARLRIDRVLRRRETLHLAASVALHGHLPGDVAACAVRAARTLRRAADETSPNVAVAVATSALRDAANGEDLIARLSTAARTPIRVLDGPEEAAFVYKGVRAGLPDIEGDAIVADLGGGSLEFAIGSSDDPSETASFRLGASRMSAMLIREDPPTPAELHAIAADVSETCAGLIATIRRGAPMPCVFAGGTARALARMVVSESDRGIVNGLVIPTAKLHSLATRVAELPRSQRMKLPGVRQRRADVLPAGALIISTIAEALDVGAITVSEWGLREGLLLEVVRRPDELPLLAAR